MTRKNLLLMLLIIFMAFFLSQCLSEAQIISLQVLDYTETIGFENADDFTCGIEHEGTYNSPWDRGGWVLSTQPSCKFEPDAITVRSGTRSAKLSLTDPSSERRLELLHDWDPLTTTDLWLESWIYLPEGFPVDGFIALHRGLYERYWGTNNGNPYYWYNGFHLGLVKDGRSSRATYNQPIFCVSVNHGSLPVDTPGYDYYPSDEWQQWEADGFAWNTLDEQPKWIPVFGEWFKVKTYVKRDIANWENGIMKIWMAFPPDYEEELIYQFNPIRTIGIDPEMLDDIGWFHDRTVGVHSMAHLSTGISLYTASGTAPKYCYFDDVTLSSEGTFTPPENGENDEPPEPTLPDVENEPPEPSLPDVEDLTENAEQMDFISLNMLGLGISLIAFITIYRKKAI